MKKKEKAEAHLYMSLRIATDADLRLGRRFDLVKFENVKEFRVKKASNISILHLLPTLSVILFDYCTEEFKKTAAENFEVPPERQRYWVWVSRQNKTFRPDAPLTPQEEEAPLEELAKRAPECRLYMEISTAPEGFPPFPPMHSDDVLIFFKNYDPYRELLQYVEFIH